MRRVIVNSTPIIVLCNIGLLDILKALYAEICIPEAVYRERRFGMSGIKDCIELDTCGKNRKPVR